jgi:cation diffusion facilitator CzcD-associated flavoprotein CzcO
VPAHLYSFSFALNPDWSRMFAPQEEILGYLERVAREHRVEPLIRYRTGDAVGALGRGRAAVAERDGPRRLQRAGARLGVRAP